MRFQYRPVLAVFAVVALLLVGWVLLRDDGDPGITEWPKDVTWPLATLTQGETEAFLDMCNEMYKEFYENLQRHMGRGLDDIALAWEAKDLQEAPYFAHMTRSLAEVARRGRLEWEHTEDMAMVCTIIRLALNDGDATQGITIRADLHNDHVTVNAQNIATGKTERFPLAP